MTSVVDEPDPAEAGDQQPASDPADEADVGAEPGTAVGGSHPESQGEAPAGPWVGTIGSSPKDPRGSAPARVVHIADEDGRRSLTIGHAPPPDAVDARFHVVKAVAACNFEVCPICLTPGPTSAEHVPPEKLGGHRMTLVCAHCNNTFGTRLEADLLDWRDDALRVRASASNVRGTRAMGRVLRRTAATGEFVLMASDRQDSSLHQMLSSGELQFEFTPPDRRKVRLAALKSAYLAVCLDQRGIPMTTAAEAVRAELIAARDAPDRHAMPESPRAQALSLWRSFGPPQGPSVALARPAGPATPSGVGAAGTDVIVWLAGTLGISWPLPDVTPQL